MGLSVDQLPNSLRLKERGTRSVTANAAGERAHDSACPRDKCRAFSGVAGDRRSLRRASENSLFDGGTGVLRQNVQGGTELATGVAHPLLLNGDLAQQSMRPCHPLAARCSLRVFERALRAR